MNAPRPVKQGPGGKATAPPENARGGSRRGKFCEHESRAEAVEFDDFVARSVATDEFHLTAGAAEGFGEQPEQRFIGGGTHGRRSHLDAQFIAEGCADGVIRSARLQFDAEHDAAGLGLEKTGKGCGFSHARRKIMKNAGFTLAGSSCMVRVAVTGRFGGNRFMKASKSCERPAAGIIAGGGDA
jgi:hypothetical protein